MLTGEWVDFLSKVSLLFSVVKDYYYIKKCSLFKLANKEGDMFSIKTFSGNNYLNTRYTHCSILGFKFRVAYHKRGMQSKYGTYATGRGRVFNFGKHYLSFIGV